MTKLPLLTGWEVIQVLEKAGWFIKSQKGSHIKLINPRFRHFIIVSVHGSKTIPRGTLANIISDTGLTVDEFIEMMHN
jgi:predicted RNA binding protein YcfA (HicA-like mRNA interferase family)